MLLYFIRNQVILKAMFKFLFCLDSGFYLWVSLFLSAWNFVKHDMLIRMPKYFCCTASWVQVHSKHPLQTSLAWLKMFISATPSSDFYFILNWKLALISSSFMYSTRTINRHVHPGLCEETWKHYDNASLKAILMIFFVNSTSEVTM